MEGTDIGFGVAHLNTDMEVTVENELERTSAPYGFHQATEAIPQLAKSDPLPQTVAPTEFLRTTDMAKNWNLDGEGTTSKKFGTLQKKIPDSDRGKRRREPNGRYLKKTEPDGDFYF